MYLFDIRKHRPAWNRFMDKFVYDNQTADELLFTTVLAQVNAVDVENDRFHIYFLTPEDATTFILKFS